LRTTATHGRGQKVWQAERETRAGAESNGTRPAGQRRDEAMRGKRQDRDRKPGQKGQRQRGKRRPPAVGKDRRRLRGRLVRWAKKPYPLWYHVRNRQVVFHRGQRPHI
jgi:hypothetical protein